MSMADSRSFLRRRPRRKRLERGEPRFGLPLEGVYLPARGTPLLKRFRSSAGRNTRENRPFLPRRAVLARFSVFRRTHRCKLLRNLILERRKIQLMPHPLRDKVRSAAWPAAPYAFAPLTFSISVPNPAGIFHGHVGKRFAVEPDVLQLQTVDEPVVRDAVQSCTPR